MPRHKQPVEVAALKGLVAHNSQRYKLEPAKTALALGSIPEHLSEGAKAVWFELETYAAEGVLVGTDRMILALLAELQAEWREDPREFPTCKIAQMISCMGRLGLSPADRQKIGTPKSPKESGFESF